MNERIESILAGLDIDLYTDEGVLMTSVLVSPKDLRKFAEQIVQECARIADEPTSQPHSSYGKKIKQHFGVEE